MIGNTALAKLRRICFVEAPDPLLLIDPTDAARFLKVKRHTLACYRSLDQGPPYYKFGRWIRYAWPDLLQWAGADHPDAASTPLAPRDNGLVDRLLLVDTLTAARFLTLTRFCLDNYRAEGSGPPYHRYGRRLYYCLNELRDWASAQRRTPQQSAVTNIDTLARLQARVRFGQGHE